MLSLPSFLRTMTKMLKILTICLLFSAASDAKNNTLVTLTPHITELVYTAGAGEHLLAVSAYSDHPEAAKSLPQIGDAFTINQELLLSLNPDVVLYWANNTSQQHLDKIQQLGIQTLPITTDHLADIPKAITQIAALNDSTPASETHSFAERIEQLRAEATPQSAFIQVSERPIYTVNGNNIMSEAMAVCGLTNVFNDLPVSSGTVSMEAVVAKDPDVIIRFSPISDNSPLKQWPNLKAIKNNQVIVVNPDHFTRPTLRLLQAIEHICQATKKPAQ